MRFSLWPWAGQTWSDIEAVTRFVAEQGWDGVYVADHFMHGPDNGDPCHECWTTLAGLAARVPHIRVGSLVTGNTYRHPAVLAKMAATVDHISGGRVVLGIGAGWQVSEHRAYGIAFPSVPDRLGALEEACQVIRSLLDADRSEFQGRHYHLEHAPLNPKPVQARLPLLVGGGGERVTLRIAARYADEWNVWGTPETMRHKIEVLDRYLAELGREPGEVRRSTQAMLLLSDDRDQVAQRRASGPALPTMAGTPGEVRSVVAEYQAAGVDELIVPDWNLGPFEAKCAVLEQFFNEVASEFR
jgi:F420-dependent oxidoreductase-like protein